MFLLYYHYYCTSITTLLAFPLYNPNYFIIIIAACMASTIKDKENVMGSATTHLALQPPSGKKQKDIKKMNK